MRTRFLLADADDDDGDDGEKRDRDDGDYCDDDAADNYDYDKDCIVSYDGAGSDDDRLNGDEYRDVTKFEFEFDNVRTSNVFNRFEIRPTF